MKTDPMDENQSALSSESAATAETTLETTEITTAISIMSRPPPNITNIDTYLLKKNLFHKIQYNMSAEKSQQIKVNFWRIIVVPGSLTAP